MIDFEFIERLIHALDNSSIDTLEIERGGTRVRLSKTPSGMWSPVGAAPAVAPPVAAPAAGGVGGVGDVGGGPARSETPTSAGAEAPADSSDLLEITSPMVGTFYRAPAPDAPAYVDVGKRVTPGDTLCIIEAMKLMNELECEIKGTIVEICVDNAQPVEFGQVLFRVDPS